ncbi:Hypothetical Protein FCC1311_060372 [Hondaea fermentalgiana]|uniref:Uncharacterized protein n=1 Tax=Hondaea fermentalgiana TaxID=2315210 RepID=A0A2R5GG13_9STRA|nr:Hypothetical Protein FCC1311_060372 [Hondaea fermentalgiana]|eukprot:GBG29817.1 Hypothetical Protein FCC1311_060372 [Hondaea fermentalgiana]
MEPESIAAVGGVRRPRSEMASAIASSLREYVEHRQLQLDASILNTDAGMSETVRGAVRVIQNLGGDVESFLAVDLARFPPYFGRAIACKASYQILLQIGREHRAAEELPWLEFCNIRFKGWDKLPAATMASVFPPCQFFYYMLVALNGATLNRDPIGSCMYTIGGNDTDDVRPPSPIDALRTNAQDSITDTDADANPRRTLPLEENPRNVEYGDNNDDNDDDNGDIDRDDDEVAAYSTNWATDASERGKAETGRKRNVDDSAIREDEEDVELKGMEPGIAYLPRDSLHEQAHSSRRFDESEQAWNSQRADGWASQNNSSRSSSQDEGSSNGGSGNHAEPRGWGTGASARGRASPSSRLSGTHESLVAPSASITTYKDHAEDLVEQMLGARSGGSQGHVSKARSPSVEELVTEFRSMSVEEMADLIEVNHLLEYDADRASQLALEWDLESGRQSQDLNSPETKAMQESELAEAEEACDVGAAAALADQRGDFPSLFTLSLRSFVRHKVDLGDLPEYIVEMVMSYLLVAVDLGTLDMREWPSGTMLELARRAPGHLLMDIPHENRAEAEQPWEAFCEVRFGPDYLSVINPGIAQIFTPCRIFYLLLQREAF